MKILLHVFERETDVPKSLGIDEGIALFSPGERANINPDVVRALQLLMKAEDPESKVASHSSLISAICEAADIEYEEYY